MSTINYNLSILIPAWNAEKYIENSVESLLENDYKNFKIYLIIGGIDNTYNLALKLKEKYPEKIYVLEQKVPNKNKALNIGLKEIDGEIIILTDIDCLFHENWLKRINEIFQNEKYNVITGWHLPFKGDNSSLAEYLRIISAYKIVTDPEISINTLTGANTAFRREVFQKKIGKFDETVKIGTDRKLGKAFTQNNENIYFFKDIYVYTEYFSSNYKKFIKRETRWVRMPLYLLKKNYILDKKFVIKKIAINFLIGIFRLVYPLFAILFSILYLNCNYLFLFLSPWVLYYFFYLIKYFIKLKKRSRVISSEINLKFNYKKAYKIIPLLFFINGIVILKSYFGYLNPRTRTKWF